MKVNQEITEKNCSENKICTISPQLRLKVNFKNSFTHINVLQNNRIGIISDNSLIIYSLYTFQEISRIFPDFLKKKSKDETQNDYRLKNFIELKNKDLVLWTSTIILFYTLYDKKYKLYQTIDKSIEEDKISKENKSYYKLSKFYFANIIEIDNGNLVLCSYLGIKLYIKKKDQYYFNYYYSTVYDLEDALSIKFNSLVLFQSGREIYDFLDNEVFFKISTFATSNRMEKTLKTYYIHSSRPLSGSFDFLINGNNLFVIYSGKLEIYDLKNNIEIHLKSYLDYFNEFLCNFDSNYFIARKDNGIINLYKFENNEIKSYEELKFDKFQIKGIKNLEKYNFFIYDKNNIKILTIKK